MSYCDNNNNDNNTSRKPQQEQQQHNSVQTNDNTSYNNIIKLDHKTIHDNVSKYYGSTLQSTNDLKTTACCTNVRPQQHIIDIINRIPDDVNNRYYGCGLPPMDGLEGLDILDLGCGSGRDCYILSSLVGENGSVTGIDMTQEQLDIAINNSQNYTKNILKYKHNNMRFVKGYIELLQDANIQPNSIDLITSNCVINLSPDKLAVLQSVYNTLRHGGEFFFSDVYSDRRIPTELRNNEILYGECLSGALYVEDFYRYAAQVGFVDVRVVDSKPIEIIDPKLKQIIGNIKFTSITFRLFKFDKGSIDELESTCEDYGQIGIYKGSITNHEHSYRLDDHHIFYTNKPVLVCGNTASMVGSSVTLGKHFDIIGNRNVHYGLFYCATSTDTNSLFNNNNNNNSKNLITPCGTTGSCC